MKATDRWIAPSELQQHITADCLHWYKLTLISAVWHGCDMTGTFHWTFWPAHLLFIFRAKKPLLHFIVQLTTKFIHNLPQIIQPHLWNMIWRPQCVSLNSSLSSKCDDVGHDPNPDNTEWKSVIVQCELEAWLHSSVTILVQIFLLNQICFCVVFFQCTNF